MKPSRVPFLILVISVLVSCGGELGPSAEGLADATSAASEGAVEPVSSVAPTTIAASESAVEPVNSVAPPTTADSSEGKPSSEVVASVNLALPIESDEEACQIPDPHEKDLDWEIRNVGFPVLFNNLEPAGVVRMVVAPIDWASFPGDPEVLDEELLQVELFIDLYESASNGALEFDVTVIDGWRTVTGSPSDYPQVSPSGNNVRLAQAAVDAVDDEIDFTDTDIFLFIIPTYSPLPVNGLPMSLENGVPQHGTIEGFAYSSNGQIVSEEGRIPNWMAAGSHMDDEEGRREPWGFYAHEAGHMFSLPDYYTYGEENWYYSPWESVEPVKVANGAWGYWSLMGGQDGPSRTFSSWSRWLLNWLSNDQVFCVDLRTTEFEPFEISLLPLDVYSDGIKTMIARTGEYTGLVIESRRADGPDYGLEVMSDDPNGIVVYRIDTRKGNAAGTLQIIPPDGRFTNDRYWSNRNPGPHLEALYREGDRTFADGLGIEVLGAGGTYDTVRISY